LSTDDSIEKYLKKIKRPIYSNIPLRLCAGRHHVVWNPEKRGSGIGKTPYRARAYLGTGKYYKASSTESKTWSTFDDTCKAYERGHFAGIGYVLNGTVTLVDVDHCINEKGDIHPAAQEILDLLNTNAEKSPSGEGIHIFPAGAIPAEAKNRYSYKGLEIEIYSSGRYSTLTGHHIEGTPTQVEDRQGELTALIEHLLKWEEENTSVCGGVLSSDEGDQQTPARLNVEQQQAPRRAAELGNNDDQAGQAPQIAQTIVSTNQSVGPAALEDLPMEDQAVYASACAARNGQTFMELWAGRDPKGRNDPSKADFDLVLQLLYWTNDDEAQTERLYRASGRYNEKTDRRTTRSGKTYLQMTIYNAMKKRHQTRAPRRSTPASNFINKASSLPPDDDPEPPAGPGRPGPGQRRPAHQDQRIQPIQKARRDETPEQHQQKLEDIGRNITELVEQHIREDQRNEILVINVGAGVGKTSAVAPLGVPGTGLSIAWMAERRDMVNQVQALSYYRHIQPCTRHNCVDSHHLHNMLGERGYNAWSVHKHHKLQCHSEPGHTGYAQQFRESGSAVYQLAHVNTRYPAGHDGIVMDEADITKWLPEREINLDRIATAARVYINAPECSAYRLLRAVEAAIAEAGQAKQKLHGLQLFNALDRHTGGQLANWTAELEQDGKYTNTHPWYKIEETDPEHQELEVVTLAPVTLPHILVALLKEREKWLRNRESGQQWNSCVRVGPGPHGYALYISERRRFTPGDEGLPPRIILDATADEEILSRLFGEKIRLERREAEAAEGTRHLAIRTGKRYGKKALCSVRKDGSRPYLARAIAEARYLLRELDGDGQAQAEQKIGLISFKGCVDLLGEALNIPPECRLHFWAARGSNQLQDCTILLVIGTPTVAPATVTRLARALWQDDPEPISEKREPDDQGIQRYIDPRMRRIDDHLTNAELTQCAHRSRAIRAPRTVVTFGIGQVDYLPVPETIIDLPRLTPDGYNEWEARREEERQRLDQARELLEEQGKSIHMITVRELKAAAHVGTNATVEYLQQARELAQQSEPGAAAELEALPNSQSQQDQDQATHTHTHLCSLPTSFVPETVSIIPLANMGTNLAPAPNVTPDACQMETQEAPERPAAPQTGRACRRCGHIDDWMWDEDGQIWLCSCYSWWYEHPERRVI
jgi:hypothetical protein